MEVLPRLALSHYLNDVMLSLEHPGQPVDRAPVRGVVRGDLDLVRHVQGECVAGRRNVSAWYFQQARTREAWKGILGRYSQK